MMRIVKRLVMGLALWAFIMATLPAWGGEAEDVARVEGLIRKIQQAEPMASDAPPRTEVVREGEINAYIAHLIKEDKQKILKTLTLTLGDENRVSGKVLFNLEGLGLGALLPSVLQFDFDGVIESRAHKGRFLVRQLLLDKNPVNPEILDMVFMAIASANNAEPVSIKDWYVLPYGVESVKTVKGVAAIYY